MEQERDRVEFSLAELISLMRGHAGLLIAVTLFAALLSAGASFLIQPRYKSIASLLPAKTVPMGGATAILQRGVIRGGFRLRSNTTPNSLNLERLVSDALRAELVDSLGLVEFFGHGDVAAENPERARHLAMTSLDDATHFELSLQIQVLIIHVTTADPEMSARIAGGYLHFLDTRNRTTYQEVARQKVRFIDTRLSEVKRSVVAAEAELARFMRKEEIADLDQDREMSYDLIGSLNSTLLDKQIAYARLIDDSSPDAPEAIALAAEIAVYETMLLSLAGGGENAGGDGSRGPSLQDMAGSGLRLETLEHELELLRDLELVLIEERETARLHSVLNTETISILDRPQVAVEPVWPRKKLIVLIVTFVALASAFITLVCAEYLRRLGGGSIRQGWTRLQQVS